MNPNQGQWDERIEYKVDLQLGEMYIEKDGFTYFLNDAKQTLRHSHSEGESKRMKGNGRDLPEMSESSVPRLTSATKQEQAENYQAHVIRSKFIGSSWKGEVEESEQSPFYNNYILGNDKSKWKGKVYSYSSVLMKDFYPGIDLRMDGNQGLKYSLEVQPGVDAEVIKIKYSGQNNLSIDEKGQLIIETRFGEIIEGTPVAWVVTERGKEKVDIAYSADNEEITFVFSGGYDTSKKLIIDPSITFSSFTGSTADNWGMSATPDPAGNVFGGGVVFSTGQYPVTTGVFNPSFSGGSIDIGITKFTGDGTALIYSTYLGGNGSETPNSTICSATGELFIFGLTSSNDFPIPGAAFDNSYNGGPNLSAFANGLGFNTGSDLFVARLSADGSTLIAATYVGGANNDGLNTSGLKYNYGDQFRGEIIVDNAGSVYVTSNSKSSDFPVTVTSPSLSGIQDAVLFKMPIALNALTWSRFFGAGGVETGNSIQLDSNGDVFVAGGTVSSGLPFNTGASSTFSGGIGDGYLAKFNSANGGFIAGTYIGSNEYDQAYFVQLDIDDNVYVLGQTQSDLGITPGLYGNANSGQFIQKYSNNLSTQLWKTMLGASTGNVEISPTAFLISDCHDIYLSGWGGDLNQNAQVSQALFSTTTGFPVTPDAYQLTSAGSNFYIGVLSQDAGFLKYGTFVGGNTTSPDHVDGGTSRFDKNGNIYHAVCAACGGQSNGFTTTPGVWSTTNNSNNCNMAVFKFELNTIEAIVSDPNPVVCLPDPVIFGNNSANGNDFYWDFGDGTNSTAVNPTHLYPGPGNYDVTLVVSDTNGCYTSDTVEFLVIIGDFTGFVTQPPAPICPNTPYQLTSSGGVTYNWSPGQFLDDSTSATPFATVSQTTDFTVIISDTCGADTLQITLVVVNPPSSVTGDTSICIGNSVPIGAFGGGSYAWSPSSTLSDTTIANPIATPLQTTTYTVDIITPEGCSLQDSVTVEVFFLPPVPVMPDSLFMCAGEQITITVSGGDTYLWSPNNNISSLTAPVVTVSPLQSMYYYADFTNICATVPDSVYITVVLADIGAFTDTIVCPGETVPLTGTGGVAYSWSPSGTLNNNVASMVYATPTTPTMYYVIGTDQYGCTDIDSVFVDLFPLAFIQTNPNVYAFLGDQVQLSATSTTNGPYVWSPSEFLTCVVCNNPVANPDQNYYYTVSYTDGNGCSDSDTVRIIYDPIIYVPNTFTPNGDQFNGLFKAEGGNIGQFLMEIYNRWGELIFVSEDIDIGWDGTYKGKKCQDGTYVWKVKVVSFSNELEEYVGHINLIR
ncbi:MAG: gliding motility-associated C-terminal domain-containing protein [Fluviicola sp.]|nr:gliding motility-associated C-terminal domain-containing protein [Fluviicola sp.]